MPELLSLLGHGQSAAVLRALTERDRVIDALYPEIENLADRELVTSCTPA